MVASGGMPGCRSWIALIASVGASTPEKSGWPLYDCAHPEGARPAAPPPAADVVADVPPRPQGGNRRRGLHDRGLDVARFGHGVHGVRHPFGVSSVQILASTPHPDEAFMRQVGGR